jgi:two-component system, cell cycle response regulator CpdR
MRILFVEDEADTRLVVGAGLRLYGFTVRMAEDGPAALRALKETSFDAVVTDVSMPNGVSGIEVAQEALKWQPSAKVLIVSGYARAQLPQLPDHVSFLGKPYGLADLVSMLRGMMACLASVALARFAVLA